LPSSSVVDRQTSFVLPLRICYTVVMTENRPTIVLKAGREKPVRNRHPWVFSGAIDRILGDVEDGALVQVTDGAGHFLATGYVNRQSQIVVRLLSWQADEAIDDGFWRRKLARAIEGRSRLAQDPSTNCYRLVHAESDGLPGLIVDRYGDWLVVQCLTLGIALWQDVIVTQLGALLSPKGIYARDDAAVRRKEGLPLQSGLLAGELPPERVEVLENGFQFLVDLYRGHKTGLYLDQRDNRQQTATYCDGKDVLNAFAYTGGFGVYAGRAGATSVINVDTSIEALELAEENLALNGCAPQELLAGDVFQVLRGFGDEGRSFDLVILDPPKFATSRGQIKNASRGYKDLNLWAMRLLRPGGVLVTFSCSGLVSADLFQKILFGASIDAKRDVQILEKLSQAADHPVLLTFPESAYLKGLVCRVW
jgi:23S rRNA (cytosine1962-C5)-methyltransferase